MQSMLDLGRQTSPTVGGEVAISPLQPGFKYLRVQIDKRIAYFALGYLDPHRGGDVEVWYSGEKEVLRLQRGRVVGAAGMATEWLGVAMASAPDWSASLASTSYTRTRDVSPGYRYGLREQVEVRRIPPPTQTSLVGMAPDALVWFEESVSGPELLPPSRYGVSETNDGWQVVYSETCLASDLCFSWQRWKP
jgi:hypothetical protein